MVSVARRMRAEHGLRWFLRGATPTLSRAFVINAVNFLVFEEVVSRM